MPSAAQELGDGAGGTGVRPLPCPQRGRWAWEAPEVRSPRSS